jgi:hypothetical protein
MAGALHMLQVRALPPSLLDCTRGEVGPCGPVASPDNVDLWCSRQGKFEGQQVPSQG